MRQYNVSKYTNGINGYSALFSTDCYQATLVGGAETTVTVPNITSLGMFGNTYNKLLAQFSYTGSDDVWVALNQTAAVPGGATLAACGTITLNPNARLVQGGDVIHMVSAGTPDVCIEFYSLNE